jgi:hypothetical protein
MTSLPGLSVLAHGPSKIGKSWIGDSSPAPRLVLDAESGSKYTLSRKIEWNPASEQPPVPDGSWDTAIVYVHDYRTVLRAYEWLNSGQHPFNSVVMDSVSEVQQRCADSLVGTDPLKREDWGTLLRQVSDLVRRFRDLTTHPIRPLAAVVLIAMTKETNTGFLTPYVQGGLATTLPYYLDVIGFLRAAPDETGAMRRFMMMHPDPAYAAGERVGNCFGPYIEIFDQRIDTITRMVNILNPGAPPFSASTLDTATTEEIM